MTSIKSVLLVVIKIIKRILKYIAVFVGSIIGMILFIILIIFLVYQYNCYSYDKFRQTKPFDSAIWQDAIPRREERGSDRSYLRCNMYRDLIKNYLHFGISYDEVVRLLGEPDDGKGE